MSQESIETPAQRVMWSADVPDEGTVVANAINMKGLCRIKIDRLFTDRRGKGIISILNRLGFEVFYDAKYIEIPSKLEELARDGVSYQPWMLNCMAGGISSGRRTDEDYEKIDGLRRFAMVCLDAGVLPCAVTVLTSKTAEVVEQEFNGRTAEDQVIFYAEVLVDCGFTDMVCSPLEAAAIKTRHLAIRTNTPAIRFADSNADDQARTNSPGGAIASHAARIIMGRDLTKGDPAENFARAIAEIEAAIAA